MSNRARSTIQTITKSLNHQITGSPNHQIVPVIFLLVSAIAALSAQSERLDYPAIGKIRDEGLSRSQVMDHISWLTDVYGRA